MLQDVFVSVVAPLKNDEDIIVDVVRDLVAVLHAHYRNYEILLVDDGSTDATVTRVETLIPDAPGLRIIRLSRAFGPEIAIAAGLDSAIGDFVAVLLPATDPPEIVPEMVDRCRAGAGIVFGVREDRAGEPWLQRAGAAGFYWLANRLLRLRMPENSTHLRVMSRQAVNAVTRIRDRFRYLRTLTDYVGYEAQSVRYRLQHRRARPRRKSLVSAIVLAVRILVSTSVQPLVLASWLAFLGALGTVAYLGYVVAIYLLKDRVAEGWTTESLVMTTMFGLLALLLGVIAAYLARLLDETQDRPLYFVMEEQGGTLPLIEAERKNVVTESTDV